jgi:hypothetical protein
LLQESNQAGERIKGRKKKKKTKKHTDKKQKPHNEREGEGKNVIKRMEILVTPTQHL